MNIRTIAEDDKTITLGWDPVAGAEGYIGTLDGSEVLVDGKRHFSLDPKLVQVRMAKLLDGKPHSYGIKLLGPLAAAGVISPQVVTTKFGTKLPARMPFSSGAGGTFYVDPVNGDDSRTNAQAKSKNTPWKTINKALSVVPASGSIIRVLPGSYTSNGFKYVPVLWTRQGDVNDPVTVQADTPGTVRIISSLAGGQTIGAWAHGGATGLRLMNLNFDCLLQPNSSIHQSHIQVEEFDKIEICDCVFTDAGTMGIVAKGSLLSAAKPSGDLWVIGNIFRPAGANPFAKVCGTSFPSNVYFGSRGSHWLYLGQFGQDPSSGGTWDSVNGLTRGVVANNIFVGSCAGGVAELGPAFRDGFVVNNIFYGEHIIQLQPPPSESKYTGSGVQLFANTANQKYNSNNNIIANNLFVDSDGHAVYGSGPLEDSNHVRYNMAYKMRNGVYGGVHYEGRDIAFEPLFNAGQPLFIDDDNNITSTLDPEFMNADGYDFHLRPSSPAIGVGDIDYMLPYNIDGLDRTQPILGAY